MITLVENIISESVTSLILQPPCDFSAVAIGSLARGEATPYSDLEYIFLIEQDSPSIKSYFEQLAMYTYFQIGNLRETKISYMAVEELEKWFDDRSTNGFKIDGLAKGAGNIPTGNGISPKNWFIVTPRQLASRYEEVLNNPNPKEALRGDLTAMLTYMKELYTYSTKATQDSLLTNFLKKIVNITPNDLRTTVNNDMLQQDLAKFNFMPNSTLQDCGFTVDVKRQLYRFPSILLFDLSILWGIRGDSAWETADLLLSKQKITESFHQTLTFLLAGACYIRLSTYLHHNSHDDRLSVAPKISDGQEAGDLFEKSQSRWFVPMGLFAAMSQDMIPLKKYLKSWNPEMTSMLGTYQLGYNDHLLARAQTLHGCGRYIEGLKTLQTVYGEDLLKFPNVVIITIEANEDNAGEVISLVADNLWKCSHYQAALEYSKHVYGKEANLEALKRLAGCYDGLSRYSDALKVLKAAKMNSPDIDLWMGVLHQKLENYQQAETYLVSALQRYCEEASLEQRFDYYGDPIEEGSSQAKCIVSMHAMSASERIRSIPNTTSDIATAISALQYFYFWQGEYELAERYNNKFIELQTELYGKDALVLATANALCKNGNNLYKQNEGAKAEQIYIDSLGLLRKIYGAESDHADIAVLLSNLGNCYSGMSRFEIAINQFEEALGVYQRLYGKETQHASIAQQLREIGWCYSKLGQHEKADKFLKESLTMFQAVYGHDNSHGDTTDLLCKLGVNCNDMRRYAEAKDYNEQVVSLYSKKYGTDKPNIHMAHALCNIGYGQNAVKDYVKAAEFYEKSLESYRKVYGCGKDHLDIANMLTHIGDNLKCMRKIHEADESYSEAMVMYRRIYEADNNDRCLASVLRGHGNRYKNMKDYLKAEIYYKESLSKWKKIYGDEANDNIAHTLHQEGLSFKEKEDYKRARESLTAALDMYSKLCKTEGSLKSDDSLGNRHITYQIKRATVLHEIGACYTDGGLYLAAAQYYQQCMEIYDGLPDTKEPTSDRAETLVSFGINQHKWDRNSDAETKLLKALALYRQVHQQQPTHRHIASTLRHIGRNYNDMGENIEAEKYYFEALAMFREIHGSDKDQEDIADILNCLGQNYSEKREYEISEEYLQAALDMYHIVHGITEHSNIASVLGTLTYNANQRGDYKKAAEYGEKSLALRRKIHGAETPHSATALCLRNLGRNYIDLRDFTQAESCFRESLSMYQTLNTENGDDRFIADCIYLIGSNYKEMNQYEKSCEWLTMSLAMYRRVYNEEEFNRSLSSVLHGIGNIHREMKMFKKASEFFNEALDKYTVAYASKSPPIHSNIANVLQDIGLNYHESKDHNSAETYFNKALDMHTDLFNHEKSLTNQRGIARCVSSLGINHAEKSEYPKAVKYLDEAMKRYKELYGENADHEDIALVLCHMGYNYHYSGNFEKSSVTFEECLAMRKRLKGEDCNDTSIALVLYNLANNYVDLKQFEKAIENYENSLIMYRKIFGADTEHEKIGSILNDLGATYTDWGKYDMAVVYYSQCLEYRRADSNSGSVGRALTLYNLHHAHLGLRDYSEARKTAQESLDIYLTYSPNDSHVSYLKRYLYPLFRYSSAQ